MPGPAALPAKGTVSNPVVAPVTMAPPATVSVPVSAQPVGVQVSVNPRPIVVADPAAHPGPAAVTNEAPSAVLAPVMDPVGRLAIPSPAEPTIQPDSVLWVSVSEDPSLNGRYLVNDASAIDFGYVGLVFLTDMSVVQAEGELKRVLEGRYLKTATVSVKMAKASYDKVGVQGSVEIPGEIKIGPGATISLSEALRRAGGLRGNRENCRVKIVRTGMKTPFGAAATGDVYSLVSTDGQLKVPEVYLRNDDLAYVFTPSTEASGQATGATGAGGKRVVLLGEVPRRGVVEFSENEPCTLMYLLFKVGGLPRFAKANQITVVRRNKDGSEQKFLIDGERIMNTGKPEDDFVLETGDRIVVPARKISFF
ncbi:MAG: polysaccharide biosynthesis/export family protein [bacterium]